MKLTVVSLFNHKSFGLDEPHYAVVADLPRDLGGGRKVLDLVPVSQERDPDTLLAGFENAVAGMPYRRTEDGGEIDFMAKDYKGATYKQNTAYIPDKSLVGKNFKDSYMDWLCWRARVQLWIQDRDRMVLSDSMNDRVLETVSPQLTVPTVPEEGFAIYQAALNNKPPKAQDFSKDVPAVLLTSRPTPL